MWEPKALELRRIAGVDLTARVDPWALAATIGLMVVDGGEALKLLPREDQAFLRGTASRSWSGGVYARTLPDGQRLCILNPTHSARRSKITLMEEVAHIHLRHIPSTLLLAADGLQVRDYVKVQEEEAYGVGAAALIPWVSLFPALDGGRTVDELAESHEVTRELIEYRVKITGAFRLYRARQRTGARR